MLSACRQAMTENRNNPTCRLETRHIRVSAEPIGKENAATIIRGKDLREVPKWLRAVMGRKKSVIRDRNRDARSSVFLPVFRRERHGQHGTPYTPTSITHSPRNSSLDAALRAVSITISYTKSVPTRHNNDDDDWSLSGCTTLTTMMLTTR